MATDVCLKNDSPHCAGWLIFTIKNFLKTLSNTLDTSDTQSLSCFCSILLGLRTNWQNENIRLFGETWSYSDALVGKTYEGFLEASFQLALLTHIQLQTSWPSMKPLFLGGTLTKAYYFRSAKPGKK